LEKKDKKSKVFFFLNNNVFNKQKEIYGVTEEVFALLLIHVEEEKLKLMLHFLRHYPTFRNGTAYWGISPYRYQQQITETINILFHHLKKTVGKEKKRPKKKSNK
jgi:hypothetical protein